MSKSLAHSLLSELLQRRQARKNLAQFAIDLDLGYVPATHHKLLLHKLEAVERGDIKRLMVCMPPGSAKSSYASVVFPAWAIGRNPKLQIIAASHTAELAEKFGRRVRNLVSSPEYQRIFGGTAELSDDSQAAGRWAMKQGGEYYAVGVGGNVTGTRADVCVIDDPVRSREDADSQTVRDKTWEWYKADLFTRLKPGGRIVLIMTRWHEDDLAGRLLADAREGGEQWELLSLPMIAEEGDPMGREPGEQLWKEWFTPEMIEQAKRDRRNWSALYQQRPTPDSGNILRPSWWQLWPKGRKLPKCDHVFVSWDTAYSTQDSKNSAHSAYSIWGVFWDEQEQRYSLMLIGAKSGQWDYPELRKQLIELDKEHAPDLHLIEKKASGQSLIQDMRRIGIPVRGYQPDRDKVSRAYAVQAMLESGQIWRPQKQWAEEFMAHLAAFPNGAPPSADYTDTATQAWLYTRNGYWMSGHPDDDGYAQRNKAQTKEPDTEEWLEDNEKELRRGVYG